MSTDHFNWHEQDLGTTFRGWLLIRLLTELKMDIDDIAERSNKFEDVRVDISINGVTVDATTFIDSLSDTIHSESAHRAAQMIEDRMPRLAELEDALYSVQNAVKKAVYDAADEAGLGTYLDREDRY